MQPLISIYKNWAEFCKEIREFLNHLSVDKRVCASTQNQAFSAVLFLYRELLQVNSERFEGLILSKRPKQIPTVVQREESYAIFGGLEGIAQLIAKRLYGLGSRRKMLAGSDAALCH